MARREAAQRAGGPLDRLHAEITVSRGSRGVTVHVEVEAPFFGSTRVAARSRGCTGGGVSILGLDANQKPREPAAATWRGCARVTLV